ncbi:helix-turn-helix domain-containing protein [Bosea sp. TAF32]|uniref:helix-turn-helix domain-containing protein n=1 Tax=Bosea sp. TAF32 TaxID=3237482 RepID=UPI003F8EBB98
MSEIPVISSHILYGLPAFLRHELGEKALLRANRAAGLDIELTEGCNCFIPHAAVIGFVSAAAREVGEPDLGLLIAPTMNVGNYGCYGRYILGGETLGQSIERAIAALCYHSTHDRMSIAITGDEARYSYVFALSDHAGYEMIAGAAAGVLLSVMRAYLPFDWRPLRIELNINRPRQTGLFEDLFHCPVLFNAPAVTVVIERHLLSAAPNRGSRPIVTIEDVARDRPGGAPRDLLAVLRAQIRAQLLTGGVSIDRAAGPMGTSVRTLQRELHRAGTDFRSLTNAARIERATELLRHTDGSITRVSAEMGYSSPANFARAFQKATGCTPGAFRSKL